MVDNLHSLIVPWTEPVDNACREILGIQCRNYDVLDVDHPVPMGQSSKSDVFEYSKVRYRLAYVGIT